MEGPHQSGMGCCRMGPCHWKAPRWANRTGCRISKHSLLPPRRTPEVQGRGRRLQRRRAESPVATEAALMRFGPSYPLQQSLVTPERSPRSMQGPTARATLVSIGRCSLRERGTVRGSGGPRRQPAIRLLETWIPCQEVRWFEVRYLSPDRNALREGTEASFGRGAKRSGWPAASSLGG